MTLSMKKSKMMIVLSAAAAAVAGAAVAGGFTQSSERAQPKAEKAQINQPAPEWTLKDLEGNEHSLSDFTGDDKIVVLEWYNPDCPVVVRHYREGTDTMNKLHKKYADKDVVWLRVNSGAEGKQGAGKERNVKAKNEDRINGAILLDMDGKVGKMYGAQTTPHMYIIDTDGVLRYMGGIDNDPSGRSNNRVNYVEQALEEILAGSSVSVPESRAYGCSVKY